MKTEFNIEEFLSLDGYATDERVARRKTNDKLKISNTNEYFTPFSLVQYMSNKISEEKWNDPNSEFLEPSFGNGNFIVYIIYNKIKHGSTWEQALSHTWGVELLESNVKETHGRSPGSHRYLPVSLPDPLQPQHLPVPPHYHPHRKAGCLHRILPRAQQYTSGPQRSGQIQQH